MWVAGPQLPPLPMFNSPSLPDLGQTLGTNVLAGVLDASDQVGDKFVDGPFVLHSPRHPLSHLDFVSFIEISLMAAEMLIHGIKRTHTTIFL